MNILKRLTEMMKDSSLDKVEAQLDPEELSDVQEELSFYASLDDNEVFEMAFPVVDAEGNLVLRTEGITYKMSLADAVPGGNVDLSKRANWISKKLDVVVKRVDIASATVYFKAAVQTRTPVRIQVVNELLEVFKNDPEAVVPARGTVIAVHPDHIVVNIVNRNVIGICRVANWSVDYTFSMEHICQKGDTYDFNIIGSRSSRGTNYRIWVLEHKTYSRSIWSQIDTSVVKPGTVLSLKCVGIDPARRTWFGMPTDFSVLPQRVSVHGFYKDSGANAMVPELGKVYQTQVLRCDVEKKRLEVQAYRPDNGDGYVMKPQLKKKR